MGAMRAVVLFGMVHASFGATPERDRRREGTSGTPLGRLVGPKMHKTGSTTLGGILARAANRYGWKARLYGTIQPTELEPRFGPKKATMPRVTVS